MIDEKLSFGVKHNYSRINAQWQMFIKAIFSDLIYKISL